MDQKELKNLLKGSKIIDVDFDPFDKTLERITIEKDGSIFLLSSESNIDGSETRIGILNPKTLERLA